jgi:hypothetical protein
VAAVVLYCDNEASLHICYIDEAGCTGALPSAMSQIQPAFVIAGVAIPQISIGPLTTEFLVLKRQFFPNLMLPCGQFLDAVLVEIKGAELRKNIAEGNRQERRHAVGFLDRVFDLFEKYDMRFLGRVWIKGIGESLKGSAVYSFSVQDICAGFQSFLTQNDTSGVVIADSRNKPKNSIVSHSIFTLKHRTAGDAFSRIVEMPTFGHSDNHVGLQLADLLCSALLFPMAMHVYCSGKIQSVHVRPGYGFLHDRYAERIKNRQYRYEEPLNSRWRGGITVSDALTKRPGASLFQVEKAH